MITQLIESEVQKLNPAIITEVFIFIIIGVFLLALLFKKKNSHYTFTGYTPTLLTSVGILGTFLGIFIGLLEFNPDDIDSSISPLLAGLKTAFLSSVVGMLFSILYKGIEASGVISSKIDDCEVRDKEIDASDIYHSLERQLKVTESLKNVIAGEGEGSMVGQLKLFRSDVGDQMKNNHIQFNDFQSQLKIQMDEFGELLAKSATEQVIDALNQVIKDFNNQLTEQFGENFKELNVAVTKLVDWQEEHKEQVSSMTALYAEGVKAIGDTKIAVKSIGDESKAIPLAMNDLRGVIETNQQQIADLELQLKAFKDIRDAAVSAVPEIRSQIDETLKGAKAANETLAIGMQESANSMKDVLAGSASDFKSSAEAQNKAMIELSDSSSKSSLELSDTIKKTIDNLDGMRTKLEVTIQEQSTSHREQAEKVFNGLESSIRGVLSDTGEAVQKQVNMIDDTMSKEIEFVLNKMGEALGQISGQFTKDYRSLVNEMEKITNAAKRN